VLAGQGQAFDVRFDALQQIVAEKQIEPAVTVYIDKRR
jgi:hypothetical protein